MSEIDIRQLISDVIDYAIEQVRQHLSAQQHELAWWATYRAALTGHCANSNDGGWKLDSCHKLSARLADLAHGPLEKKP